MRIPRTVEIKVDPPYPVLIGPGLLDQCGDLLKTSLGLCSLAVITDSNVANLYLERVLASLKAAGYAVCAYAFPAGEASKNMATLGEILEFLAKNQLSRDDAVIALGGGVCGDMAGFASGVYLRGIRFVQLPTTLLAAVDSSVGGKTAVDLTFGKNLAGLFHQPSAVLCDTDSLDTLPQAFLADGMAEALKTGILAGEELFKLCSLEKDSRDLTEIIAQCVTYKGKIVEADEFDSGLRNTLNLGHSAGHAIEKCSDYTIPHGHAVAMGLALIARAAEKLGWSEAGLSARISAALRQNDLPVITDFSAKELAQAALADKKRRGDDITLVIPVKIGQCILKKVPVSQLEAIFQAGLEG